MKKQPIRSFLSATFFVLISTCSMAQNANSKATESLKNEASGSIQSGYDVYKKIALSIWGFAEVGYKEVKSSALLQGTLKANGFTVEAGVAGIPTAFVATYGSGSPVIGILLSMMHYQVYRRTAHQ